MLSRVANTIYWLSRYLERAEDTARIINVHSTLLLDLPKNMDSTLGWDNLIAITGSEATFYQRYKICNERNVSKFLLGATDSSSSIMNAIVQARDNMRGVRELIPREAWEQTNDLYFAAKTKLNDGINKSQRYDFLKFVICRVEQLTGLLHGTMSRDTAYRFMQLGWHLERADMTTRILDVGAANLLPKAEDIGLTPFANIQWMGVLKSLTAYQMYRQHVRLRVRGPDVLKFLLQDKEFPRAFAYCLEQLEQSLGDLPHNDLPLRRLARLQRQADTAEVHTLAEQGLHEFIDELQIGLAELHSQIHQTYFSAEINLPALAEAQA